ncbi:agmatine deiminase family protein [Sphingomonas nostoxanthinifaciens]|uniref:agmatine deiminase family protein n=1 Tax=Sphingomonas nostoxanthinifaciens TaxID=2872652 RepID=UPI001CC21C88|nr:agmatine deiminase family protein [Sphingomonas nostoxanthinifaciens]UAK24524.1 agmatine deiminase family protein [Sphingomonas nostoxanthinifaciens]
MSSTRAPALRQPPEWAPHASVWIGWPSHPELWEENLAPAQAEVAGFARAVHAGGKGERVVLVAANDAAAAEARAAMGDAAEVVVEPFGDVWLRDTGAILLDGADGLRAARFGFNWWGGKYHLPGDEAVGARLAEAAGFAIDAHDWVLEGGAIDVDGTGLAVTTEQCLLNPNRNPGLLRADIERRLAEDLGLDRVLWLGEGLAEDHTDGHVDNLARFVGPNRLAIPVPADADDPNAAIYADAKARAEAFGVEVVPIPSPGLTMRDGEIVPASYMNFYIGNAAVVVPIHGMPNDAAAVAAIGAFFPDRVAVGVRSDHVLSGGGSFHCISQQVPRV